MKRTLLSACLVALLLALAVPSYASSVAVTLKVTYGKPNLVSATGAECAVTVPAGSNGITVLQEAVAKGCISSYQTTTYGNGNFVSCIDYVCGAVATYWAMRENGTYTSYGVDGFTAEPGDVLWFAYEEFVTCYPLGIDC